MSVTAEKVKEQVLKTGLRMAGSGLVAGTWGNITARVPGEHIFVVTPSGIPYDAMSKTDLVVVDGGGRVIEGERRPSTELKLHLAVYNARPDAGAIVHTHSVYASALAVAGKPLPPILEDQVQLAGDEVPVARYARAGTSNLAAVAVEALGQNNAVLLANHGLVGIGRTVEEAFTVCQVVEKAARVYTLAELLGRAAIIPPGEVVALRDAYLTAYGQPRQG
ncbi:class II aldolase/adducin family protein [Desulfoscipio geothermicus]|uniref:L-fuculose-phosphate aldolase n=1 Tax=Desulfoscipio geothermicus DSM 3669 TaxID=1121426 RepID=A0A1I6D747_9FIRM|nr:class II aldolase/adducin family protein [Desulfoscipio geothermicus]SFR01122.1 L-fuculose-phosphate aldolase [Desulfoscipio geothermicus DSM 3669]